MGFLNGFLSVFNLFPSRKTYAEQNEELDNQMQDLYDKMDWGLYINPCEINNHSVDLTRSISSSEWNSHDKDVK